MKKRVLFFSFALLFSVTIQAADAGDAEGDIELGSHSEKAEDDKVVPNASYYVERPRIGVIDFFDAFGTLLERARDRSRRIDPNAPKPAPGNYMIDANSLKFTDVHHQTLASFPLIEENGRYYIELQNDDAQRCEVIPTIEESDEKKELIAPIQLVVPEGVDFPVEVSEIVRRPNTTESNEA